MRLLLALLLFLAPTPPNATLQAELTQYGVTFTVSTTAPASFYAQIDTEGGAIVQGNRIYLFDLDADQTFAKTVSAARGVADGVVIVRVWASNNAPVLEQRVPMPARADVLHVYVPLFSH
jgi:hypothetical protein